MKNIYFMKLLLMILLVGCGDALKYSHGKARANARIKIEFS